MMTTHSTERVYFFSFVLSGMLRWGGGFIALFGFIMTVYSAVTLSSTDARTGGYVVVMGVGALASIVGEILQILVDIEENSRKTAIEITKAAETIAKAAASLATIEEALCEQDSDS